MYPMDPPNYDYERTMSENSSEAEIRPVWTNLMEEMLIYFIRANRLLWDPCHPHFTRPTIKRKKVEDIAAIIKREADLNDDFVLNPEDVWRKFRNLRTVFVREVRKVNSRNLQGNEEPYTSTWIHFERMLFLTDSLKKSIEANVPVPISGTGPAAIKLEGARNRAANGVATLNNLQQNQQESEDELRIGGEWVSSSNLPTGPGSSSDSSQPGSSYSTSVDRNCDNVISRSSSRIGGPSSKKAKLSHNQEKKLAEVSEAFGKYVIASINRLPEDKQPALMAHISNSISEFHKK